MKNKVWVSGATANVSKALPLGSAVHRGYWRVRWGRPSLMPQDDPGAVVNTVGPFATTGCSIDRSCSLVYPQDARLRGNRGRKLASSSYCLSNRVEGH